MNTKEVLRDCIAAAVAKHPSDMEAAIDEAARSVRAIGDDTIDAFLWRRGLAEQVYDLRHSQNRDLRGSFMPSDPKVIAGNSETTSRVGLALAEYDKRIAGYTLGDLLGEQLIPLAETEDAIAAGHKENATLLRMLRPMVKDGKSVRECVSVRKLRAVFVRLYGGEKPGENENRIAAVRRNREPVPA
jgi:hypothetical protein